MSTGRERPWRREAARRLVAALLVMGGAVLLGGAGPGDTHDALGWSQPGQPPESTAGGAAAPRGLHPLLVALLGGIVVGGTVLIGRELRRRGSAVGRGGVVVHLPEPDARRDGARARRLRPPAPPGAGAPVGLFRLARPDGRLVGANPTLLALLGYPDEPALRAAFDTGAAWVDPAERARILTLLATDGSLDGYEAAFRRRDGSPVWLRLGARAVGEVVEAAALDVTEERWAREELARAEQRLRTLADTTPALLFVVSPDDGHVTYANRAAQDRVGRTAAELAQVPFESLFAAADRATVAARRAEADGDRRSFEARLDGPGPDERWVELTAVLTGLDGRPAWVVTGFDTTARRAAERQVRRAEKMAALGVVIAGVAHEINNPNNFIVFNLPVLREAIAELRPVLERAGEVEPDLRLGNLPAARFLDDLVALVGDMEQGSQRITRIVSELRRYVRSAESEQHRPERPGVVVERALALVGKQVRRMVATLETDVEDGLPPVLMDPGKLEQALINLVINAAQAADKPDSRITVRARRCPDRPQRVLLEVADNGAGIPPAVLPRIFDPFFTTKGRDAGTGLGLGIVERIVEEHGGTVDVQTRVGHGSTFTIELPAAPSGVAAASAGPTPGPTAGEGPG